LIRGQKKAGVQTIVQTRPSFSAFVQECPKPRLRWPRRSSRCCGLGYIETFDNPSRRHSALGDRSPLDFEKQKSSPSAGDGDQHGHAVAGTHNANRSTPFRWHF
jgi:hypothetical protein